MAKPVGGDGGRRGGAVPSGDSPKPHGDKFASAARRSAAPGEGGSESEQGDD